MSGLIKVFLEQKPSRVLQYELALIDSGFTKLCLEYIKPNVKGKDFRQEVPVLVALVAWLFRDLLKTASEKPEYRRYACLTQQNLFCLEILELTKLGKFVQHNLIAHLRANQVQKIRW
jgi:hypothetical protein